MDAKLSPRSQNHELGSWHPAMRPNSQGTDYLEEQQEHRFTQHFSNHPQDPSPLASQNQHNSSSTLLQPSASVSSVGRQNLYLPQTKSEEDENSAFLVGDSFVKDAAPSFDNKENRGNLEDHNSSRGSLENLEIKNALHLGGNHNTDQADGVSLPQRLPASNEGVHKGVLKGDLDQDNVGEFSISWDANQHFANINSENNNVDRASTFPAIPPLHQANALPNQRLSRSQAQAIMEEDQNHENLENGKVVDLSSKFEKDESVGQNYYVSDGYKNHFSTSQSTFDEANVLFPEHEEVRFQEGLPLVPSKSSEAYPLDEPYQALNKPQTSPKWFDSTEDDDHDFSKEIGEPSQDQTFFKPQSLDRKTTAQVLNSLHYAPRHIKDAEPDRQTDLLSHADLASGAPYGLKNTSNIENPADKEASETESELKSSAADQSQEQDLAAMWQAVLDDDGLLDDDDASLNPSSFFRDDGEGFLENKFDQNIDKSSSLSQFPSKSHLNPATGIANGEANSSLTGQVRPFQAEYTPSSAQSNIDPSSGYFPPQNLAVGPRSTMQMASERPNPYAGLSNQQGQIANSSNFLPTRPALPVTAQSFSDKSKGGYTSPYDLPMDVARPRKRTHPQPKQPALNAQNSSQSQSQHPPPPRNNISYPFNAPQVTDSRPPIPQISSGTKSVSEYDSRAPRSNQIGSIVASQHSAGSFFEELPATNSGPPSSRSKSVAGFTQQNQNIQAPFQNMPAHQMPPLQGSAQNFQLLPPEKIGLYANVPPQEVTRHAPLMNPRYSPAPGPQHSASPVRNRYTPSPSGVSRPAPPSQSISFQPRTSSPLAQNSKSQHYPRKSGGDIPRNSEHQSVRPDTTKSRNDFPDQQIGARTNSNQEGNLQSESERANHMYPPRFVQPSPPMSEPSYAVNNRIYASQNPDNGYTSTNDTLPGHDFVSQGNHDYVKGSSQETNFKPPQRSQTQSPGAVRSKTGLPLNIHEPFQRPASANHPGTPLSTNSIYSAAPNQTGSRSRNFSQRFDYIAPTDGREYDPLERWKGCPIISFGFGGTVVTSFPKQIPRYSAGQSTPMLKCSPGEVKLSVGKVVSLEENIVNFPGPLKSKGKKKEVLDWLQKRTAHLEGSHPSFPLSSALPDAQQHFEEKILLWKVLQILVEYDGMIEGNLIAISAVRSLLLPELAPGNLENTSSYHPVHDISRISKRSGLNQDLQPSDPEALEGLRKLLLHGEREKAVWYAVDQRLWDHAMLLSSTLEPRLWKQVLQEFIRQEVKTYGQNTEGLASLYQIFAGNWEESVDELVPPSARAGLQMVSKAPSAGPVKNALDGLERWRETLVLILGNRSHNDSVALATLGRLLSSYGRTEAAHICFIFAKVPGLFGGVDDPQAGVVLLGANQTRFPFDFDRDLDSILLTEIYDFATTTLTASSTATISSYIQPYKLYHATLLAENGHRLEAQQYCDVITNALKSTTKLSPYYHSVLFGALEDLVERLRQAPKDGSASWMSKPSMDKVSGSVWAKFNQFIAGDESDKGSVVSGRVLDQDGTGPFARVSGDSPSISRMPSSNELYSNYPVGNEITSVAQSTNLHSSRYAPTGQYAPVGQYTPRLSLEQARDWSLQEPRRQSESDSLRPILPQQYQSRNSSTTERSRESPPNSYKPLSQPLTYSPRSQSYLPTPPSQPEYVSSAFQDESSLSMEEDLYRPTPPPKDESHPQPYPLPRERQLSNGNKSDDPNSTFSGYKPLSPGHSPSGYDPPTYSYEPPSYNPDPTDDAESPLQEKPKKKSFMDDEDDDFEAREAAIRKEEKSKKDRDVDEAVRKAAEADAQKDIKLNTKKSWFGSWLGGRKDSDSTAAPSNTPIRAKLGEESSFYYDSDLKKWVNKKAGAATAETNNPKPPPPKGPPSRAVSAAAVSPPSASAPPPVPPLPTSTTPANPGATPPINISNPPSLTSPPTSLLPTPSPSRSFSSAAALPSTTEEPTPPPPTISSHREIERPDSESRPPSRPTTGMSGISDASSVDDIYGQLQARKGGTIRKGKKGRYIDPLAK